MRKNIKEPKSKKINPQNKLKKALYPKNTKPITLETYIGINNPKAKKKTNNKQKQKMKNEAISPPPSRKTKNRKMSEKYQTNKSQNNSNILELDYLNFSRIDIGLRKLNSSFDEDIFNSKIFIKEKKELVSNRYNGIESSFETSKNDTNNNLINNNNNYIKESKEKLLKTPSTLCNYYDKSEATTSQKKNNINNNKNIEEKNELRKNLDKLYEESKNDDIEYISVNKKNNQNIINWKLKDSIKITKNKEKEKKEEESNTLKENKKELNKLIFDIKRDFAKTQSQKKISKKENNINNNNYKNEIPYKNNLMENYLNSKITKRKNSYNASSSKKYSSDKMIIIPKEISKTLKYTNDNIKNNTNNTQDINSLINMNFNSTMNANGQNVIINNAKNKKANNTTNGIYYINSNAKNYKQYSHSGQKPIILCYDQMKYDSYFVTPKNVKKLKKGKVITSTKSTKYDSNSRGLGTNNTKNKTKANDSNLLINNLVKNKNKSFNKIMNNNFIRNNTNNINNKIIYINNNKIINHKSSSLLINKQHSVLSNNNKGRNSQNSNSSINTILKLLNSGVKKNSQLLQDLLSKVSYSNSNTKSPMKKYKSSNALKISKTLTEQNILNRMQVTPKYNKIPKGSNALTTTLVKRNIYIGSNVKNNNKGIKYHNSTVKKNNNQFFGSNNYKDILSNLFNHKTQSDFKTNKYFVLNNSNINSNKGNKYSNNKNEYGNDKHIKQKLLDRMNNATNNWQYVFRGNKNSNNNNGNKKVLMENLSEIMKSPDKKDFINNDTIISNESYEENGKK